MLCVRSAEADGRDAQRPRLHQPHAAGPAGAPRAGQRAPQEGLHLRPVLRGVHQAHQRQRRRRLPQAAQVSAESSWGTLSSLLQSERVGSGIFLFVRECPSYFATRPDVITVIGQEGSFLQNYLDRL